MKQKHILSVAFDIPGDNTEYVAITSNQSLADGDIVILEPDISSFCDYTKSYQGKPSLYESSSFRLKESIQHWQREVAAAVAAGKSVFVLPKNTPVFIGSWGDVTKGDSPREVFTYISEKTNTERINLAIVRIKEEEDFFDYFIFRFVEILNEVGLMDEKFYKLAKYGTTDKKTITMIQNGFSRGVAELLRKDYSDFFKIIDSDIVSVNPTIHQHLIDDGVGFLQRHEVSLNVKSA